MYVFIASRLFSFCLFFSLGPDKVQPIPLGVAGCDHLHAVSCRDLIRELASGPAVWRSGAAIAGPCHAQSHPQRSQNL